jgi:hypothetical protein
MFFYKFSTYLGGFGEGDMGLAAGLATRVADPHVEASVG